MAFICAGATKFHHCINLKLKKTHIKNLGQHRSWSPICKDVRSIFQFSHSLASVFPTATRFKEYLYIYICSRKITPHQTRLLFFSWSTGFSFYTLFDDLHQIWGNVQFDTAVNFLVFVSHFYLDLIHLPYSWDIISYLN